MRLLIALFALVAIIAIAHLPRDLALVAVLLLGLAVLAYQKGDLRP